MSPRTRPFLLTLMLMAIGLRTIVGAPCCLDMAQAAPLQIEAADASDAVGDAHAAHGEHGEHGDHGDHGDHEGPDHSGHADSHAANPCCSACGPTLPPETPNFALQTAPRDIPEPAPIRGLATRPPYPAYEATGPPLLI